MEWVFCFVIPSCQWIFWLKPNSLVMQTVYVCNTLFACRSASGNAVLNFCNTHSFYAHNASTFFCVICFQASLPCKLITDASSYNLNTAFAVLIYKMNCTWNISAIEPDLQFLFDLICKYLALCCSIKHHVNVWFITHFHKRNTKKIYICSTWLPILIVRACKIVILCLSTCLDITCIHNLGIKLKQEVIIGR